MKLEAFLRVIAYKQFFYGAFIEQLDDTNTCIAVGCALGWCPTVFPKEWKVKSGGELPIPALRSKPERCQPIRDAMEFFGVSNQAAQHLFLPCCQNTERYGGKILDSSATATQVANNIKAFLGPK